MRISLRINLPDNFRRQDFLIFHQRDSHMLAEHWDEKTLHKGILWENFPTALEFRFSSGNQLQVIVDIDSGYRKIDAQDTRKKLRQLIKHMLGLNQATEEFEAFASSNVDVKDLIAQQLGLRVPQSASPFEALTWAITGQQISLGVAISLRRKLIQLAGIKHSSGIYCYPGPEQLLAFNQSDLRNCSFSQTKADTLLNLAKSVQDGELPLTTWVEDYWNTKQFSAEHIYEQLIQKRGIGPWTIHYALLRGFGWLDGSLHGDAAVRRNLQKLLCEQKKYVIEGKISEIETQKWLANFSPWRALVAAHLWAMQSNSDSEKRKTKKLKAQ